MNSKHTLFLVGLGLYALAVFAIDGLTPYGLVDWALYLLVILALIWARRPRQLLIGTAACSGLSIIGLFLAHPGMSLAQGVVNRIIGLGIFWLTAFGGLMLIRQAGESTRMFEVLEKEWQERRRVQDSLRRVQDQFEAFMANSPAVAFMKDEDGRYVYVNKLYEQLFRSLDHVRGNTDFEVFPEPIAQQLMKNDKEVLEANTPRQIEEKVPLSSGSMHQWIVIKFPFRDRAGKRYVGGMAIDVTERVQAEQQLLQAQRLAAIGQAMAGLAHESRNALQRSQAALDLLVLRIQDRPEALELVSELEHAQDYLHHLYEEVQGYAAPLNLRRRPVHLGEILEQTWRNLLSLNTGRTASLNQLGTELDLVCPVDAGAIEQVLRNILENSLAACRDPVQITARWSQAQLPCGAAVRLALRDNGPGWTPQSRANVFEPFFTTKTKGTGLGMAIAKRIVENHNGQISVSEDDSPGAEVVVTLPK